MKARNIIGFYPLCGSPQKLHKPIYLSNSRNQHQVSMGFQMVVAATHWYFSTLPKCKTSLSLSPLWITADKNDPPLLKSLTPQHLAFFSHWDYRPDATMWVFAESKIFGSRMRLILCRFFVCWLNRQANHCCWIGLLRGRLPEYNCAIKEHRMPYNWAKMFIAKISLTHSIVFPFRFRISPCKAIIPFLVVIVA